MPPPTRSALHELLKDANIHLTQDDATKAKGILEAPTH